VRPADVTILLDPRKYKESFTENAKAVVLAGKKSYAASILRLS
jgi:hypothetical protein